MRYGFIFVVIAVLCVGGRCLAEDSPKADPKPSAKREAVYRLFDEWKKVVAEMLKVTQSHLSARGNDRKEIEQKFDKLLAKGEKIRSQLLKAAEAYYCEAPGADRQVEEFLVIEVNRCFSRDDFEKAYQLANMLIEHGCKVKELYLWGGISALCINQLDTAEEYLSEAVKRGVQLKTKKGDPLDPTVNLFQLDPRPFKKRWKDEQEIRKKEAKADDLPRVLIKTNKGDIVVELFENEAPNTVANFITLVEKGFYNGLTFHRVLPGFVIQGGCPHGNGTGGPGYTIACECGRKDHRNHFRGSLSMARGTQPDTGGSQFFLTLSPTAHLDGKHTVFGRVIKGMDVLSKIRKRDPSDPKATLAAPDEIIEMRVLRKRPHPYEVKKITK